MKYIQDCDTEQNPTNPPLDEDLFFKGCDYQKLLEDIELSTSSDNSSALVQNTDNNTIQFEDNLLLDQVQPLENETHQIPDRGCSDGYTDLIQNAQKKSEELETYQQKMKYQIRRNRGRPQTSY